MSALSLLLALLLPTATFAASAGTKILRTYPDVQTIHPNYEAIMYLTANGVVQGNPNGMFSPDGNINRAEFTKIIVESLADQNVIETCVASAQLPIFKDVLGEEWYARHICVAKTYGLAQGNPDGTYRPNTPINFAEASKMISTNFDLYRGGPGTGSTVWFEPYVRAMAEKSAIPVSITNFDEAITRGEMAEMIYRIRSGIPPKPSLTYDQLEKLTRGQGGSVSSARPASSSAASAQASVQASAQASPKASAASQASAMSSMSSSSK